MAPDFFSHLIFKLPQASANALETDRLFFFIFWASVICFVPTMVAFFYFAIKYRESKTKNAKVPFIHGNGPFEWTVSVVLSIYFLVAFGWGLSGYYKFFHPPRNAYEINVIGQQWLWQFQYPNGKVTTNELYVPADTPVKLILSSRDVIHDFYVPNFRVKHDVVPGRYTSLWFKATEVGENDLFCTKYCGTAHSNMIGKVIVMEPAKFQAWLLGEDPNKVSLTSVGEKVFRQRNCITCHSVDGSPRVGPSMKGLFGRSQMTADGRNIVVDEDYIRDVLTNPNGNLVPGYRAIMPTFKGLLTEEDMSALVSYVKSLKE